MPKRRDNTLYGLHIAQPEDGGCFPGAFRPKKKQFLEG